ncbi:TetR/AcrR family transcriptional regulator [Novosphingobium profundi]|uniref:TetR family transcriptional regulator n=1 Tax=Novosphingobium profundi TaxID=1774954 RepID=UPI001BD967B1|nr:TetR family transcriptional regulator [Novosphingobium profundi]MBT0667112.1 TetR/AcrR family transcriptional regulator [Novosphingobium profundi]
MDDIANYARSTPEHLISAVLNQWQTHGSTGISARRISAAAMIPVSSIYHHFGSLEHLLSISQDTAIARARAWCDRQFDHLDDYPRNREAFAPFFAYVIDDWCETQRELAFAWREGELHAERSEALHARVLQWQRLWSDFWSRACDHFQIEQGRIVVERVFDSESLLHLIRWRRTVDRAGLGEFAQVLGSWLTGTSPPPTPWRDHARAIAIATQPSLPERDEVAARIVAEAAKLLGNAGSTHLTHRLVARHAGVTLGTVSHKFRTKSDLLGAAFEGVYLGMVERMSAGPGNAPTDTRVGAVADSILLAASERARNELFLAVARDRGLERFGRQLRYLRGRTGFGMLQSLLGDSRVVTPTEGALFSAFGMAQIRVHSLNLSDGKADQIKSEYQELLALLRPR